jgi:transcription elongation factor Elf1
MPGEHGTGVCDFCHRRAVVRTMQEIDFRQLTDKGYVRCQVTVAVAVCEACGARSWDDAAEATIDEAVKRETDRLP